MNRLRKIAIGAGLAVAALATISAPANAATQSDRLEGPARTVQNNTIYNMEAGQPGTAIKNTSAQPSTVSIPAPYTTGDVRFKVYGQDLCMTRQNPIGYYAHLVTAPCDGSAAQQFYTHADGKLQSKDQTLPTTTGDIWLLNLFEPNYTISKGSATNAHRFDLAGMSPVQEPVAAAPVDITTPTAASTTSDTTPTFSGTGEPGASIVVKDSSGTQLCTTTVTPDGKWSCDSTVEMEMGEKTVTATQTDANNTTTTDSVKFVIALPTPFVAPGIAVTALGILGAAGAFIKRRLT